MGLFVRTGNAGTDPDFSIDDLGFTVIMSGVWLQLDAGSPSESIITSSGQFFPDELRNSQDLYDAITSSGLEWSIDGVIISAGLDYTADFLRVEYFSDDDMNLSNGRLTSPQGTGNPLDVRPGEFFYNNNENQLYVGVGSNWEEITMAAARSVLLDEVKATKLTYVGEASPNTATSAAAWRIYRLDESNTGDEELIKLYANNSTSFDQIWDNRTSLSYNLPS